jgi:hypothetical protein
MCHEKTRQKNSVAGTRTRVSRVRAEYPNQLDYNGACEWCEIVVVKYSILKFLIKSEDRPGLEA